MRVNLKVAWNDALFMIRSGSDFDKFNKPKQRARLSSLQFRDLLFQILNFEEKERKVT